MASSILKKNLVKKKSLSFPTINANSYETIYENFPVGTILNGYELGSVVNHNVSVIIACIDTYGTFIMRVKNNGASNITGATVNIYYI